MTTKLMLLMILSIVVLAAMISSDPVVMAASQFTAMYAFGDSLIDPGNNNYLNSLAKANYFPYGVDFYEGPSGRFSNGKTIVDYLGELLGIPPLLPYTSPFATGRNIRMGVNYASAAGGILEETGRNLGERFSLSGQIQNFRDTLNEIKNQMGDQEFSNYLAKALVVVAIGSNDYINNYLQPSFYSTRDTYKPQDYADLLINRYAAQISGLHNLGLRKFLLGAIGPLGCIPNQLASSLAPPGKCVDSVNNLVAMFNTRLMSLVNQMNANYKDSIFVYGNTFDVIMDIIVNAKGYGFAVADTGCCGIGRNQGQITCLPFSLPCVNRNQYVFWDAFHPTQAVSQILARRAYIGPPTDCYPANVQQMAKM